MPPETSPTNQISIEPYEKAFKSLFYAPADSKNTVPVIQAISEPKKSIEIPEMLKKFLERAIDSRTVMVREVAFFPKDIFMVLETEDSDSPKIFGAVFNLTERRFFTRELVIKDAKSVSPLLEPTKIKSDYRAITKDGILILTSLIEDISQQPNVKYSLHKKVNPIGLTSSFRYFVTTKGGVKKTSSQDAGRIANA